MNARYLSLAPLVNWRQTVRPIRWAEQFKDKARLEVEIGFGNGEYLVRNARQHPERNFVGIELEWASIQRGLRKIAQSRIDNVRLMQVSAQVAFERLFSPATIDRVYTLFPCPWPKERHRKHRLFARPFLRLLNSRLTCNGSLHIVTDHPSYRDWVAAETADTGFAFECRQIPAQFSTKYERKWQAQGHDHFYALHLRKQHAISLPIRKDQALQTHRLKSFDPEHFRPIDQHGKITIKFKDLIYDPKQKRAMQWVLIAEDNFAQDIWIDIAQRENGWLVRPARGCPFIPTQGVQQALDIIRDTTLVWR